MDISKAFFDSIKKKGVSKKQAEEDLTGKYSRNLPSRFDNDTIKFLEKALTYAGLKLVPAESNQAVVGQIIELAKKLENK